MDTLSPVLARIDGNLDSATERLFDLLSIPSISTDPANRGDCQRAAEWVRAELASLGFEARICPTAGHPVVMGHGGPVGGAHVLFYGHYDVQPVDPLNLWEAPPFSPQLVTGADGRQRIVARGSSDDKGQFMTFIEACRAHIDAHGGLPARVSVIIEGEEEDGSQNLPAFLAEHGDELKADAALICDTSLWDYDTAAITLSLRGLCAEEFIVTAANRDLHSGLFGGAARNPIRVVADVLASLRDDNGRCTLPGFYNGVPETPAEVRDNWAKLGFDPAAFLGAVGLSEPAGEPGRSVLEQLWARPTIEFNGVYGGYMGDGFKTVLPGKAGAKVSFRLVADQDPEAIRAAFRARVREHLPADCTVEFKSHAGSKAVNLPHDRPIVSIARKALTDEWEREAALVGSGASIPVVGMFHRSLGLDCLCVGFALDDDRIHSPNEKYDLRSFHKGIRSWARILDALRG